MISIILFLISIILYFFSQIIDLSQTLTILLWFIISTVGVCISLCNYKHFLNKIGSILNGLMLLFSLLLIIALFIN